MAWQAAEAARVTRVRIVGDARRDQWWTRCFRRAGSVMIPVADWELVHAQAFQVGAAEAVATPDWARIGELLQATVPPTVMLIARALLPDAETLGRLAAARIAQGIASEPLAPIYLHPAVHRKPKDCQAASHPV